MKKNYQKVKENPALSYITQMNDDSETPKQEDFEIIMHNASEVEIEPVPKGYRICPQYSEVKTRRVQLVFPPSLFKKVQTQAKKANMSVNEFVCLILDAVINKNEQHS